MARYCLNHTDGRPDVLFRSGEGLLPHLGVFAKSTAQVVGGFFVTWQAVCFPELVRFMRFIAVKRHRRHDPDPNYGANLLAVSSYLISLCKGIGKRTGSRTTAPQKKN